MAVLNNGTHDLLGNSVCPFNEHAYVSHLAKWGSSCVFDVIS